MVIWNRCSSSTEEVLIRDRTSSLILPFYTLVLRSLHVFSSCRCLFVNDVDCCYKLSTSCLSSFTEPGGTTEDGRSGTRYPTKSYTNVMKWCTLPVSCVGVVAFPTYPHWAFLTYYMLLQIMSGMASEQDSAGK